MQEIGSKELSRTERGFSVDQYYSLVSIAVFEAVMTVLCNVIG